MKLIDTILACTNKCSENALIRDNPSDSITVGDRFSRKRDNLSSQEKPLSQNGIATVVELVVLDSTFSSRAKIFNG